MEIFTDLEMYLKNICKYVEIYGNVWKYLNVFVATLCIVQRFLLERVPKSSHQLSSLDSQPVPDTAVGGQTTVLVQVSWFKTYTVISSKVKMSKVKMSKVKMSKVKMFKIKTSMVKTTYVQTPKVKICQK